VRRVSDNGLSGIIHTYAIAGLLSYAAVPQPRDIGELSSGNPVAVELITTTLSPKEKFLSNTGESTKRSAIHNIQ